MKIIFALVLIAILVAGAALLWLSLLDRSSDPQRAQPYYEAVQLVRRRPELALIMVKSNYQLAREGTKSWVYWVASGRIQDTWFHWRRYQVGQYLVVAPHTGYGPHNRNPNVLYVEPQDVVLSVSTSAIRAAQRLNR